MSGWNTPKTQNLLHHSSGINLTELNSGPLNINPNNVGEFVLPREDDLAPWEQNNPK
jgi:hypothetical protein